MEPEVPEVEISIGNVWADAIEFLILWDELKWCLSRPSGCFLRVNGMDKQTQTYTLHFTSAIGLSIYMQTDG